MAERRELLRRIEEAVGTSERRELRRLSLAGALAGADVGRVDRLRSLDYLLHDE